MNGNIAIFIDAENLIRSFRNEVGAIDGAFIDFQNLKELLADGRSIVCSKAYGTYSPRYGISTILADMELEGFNLELEKNNKWQQKGVDIRMALGINRMLYDDNCDSIVIVSGDGDFVPIARFAKEMGKTVEVASFRSSMSSELANTADRIIDLGDLSMIDTRAIRRGFVAKRYITTQENN